LPHDDDFVKYFGLESHTEGRPSAAIEPHGTTCGAHLSCTSLIPRLLFSVVL
jgi:hypothetical protein